MKILRNVSEPIISATLCVAVLLLALPSAKSRSGFRAENEPMVYTLTGQSDDALITELVSSLRSTKTEVRTDSEKKLIALAQMSAEKRELVINKLLSSVNAEKEVDGTHNVLKTSFPYWESVANIFGELDARQAVDVLIRCIQCSSGWSGNMGEPPASVALVRMGRPVLPNLSKALGEERVAYKRMKIVLCIARIGGSEAITDLEQALRSESHADVREVIKFNLSQMKSHN